MKRWIAGPDTARIATVANSTFLCGEVVMDEVLALNALIFG